MKKHLFIAALLLAMTGMLRAQCVPTCSTYLTYTVPYAPYPVAGNNAIPLFTPNTDDGLTSPIYIGFNFNYYCTTYSTVLIYSNGLIQFDIGAPSTFPFGYDPAQNFPSGTAPNGLVAFRMDDLDPGVGGQVTYTTLGTSPNQTFVVTYSNVPVFGNSAIQYSGQIALYETSNMIDIITILAPTGPNLATQGIENASGSLGTGVPGRNMTSWSASSPGTWRFQGIGPAPLPAITGSASTCQGVTNSYSINSTATPLYYTWSTPAGWAGTSTTTALSALAGSSGQLSLTATYTCGVTQPVTFSVTVIPSPTVAFSSASPAIFCSGPTVTFQTTGATSYTIQPGNISGTPPFYATPYTTTTYSLTGVNASGCLSTNFANANITVKQTPTVTVPGGEICLGGSFLINPSGAATYTNSNGFFATVTPSTAGTHTYYVVGTATNGCVSNSVICTVTVNALPVLTATPSRTAICVKESTSLTATGAQSYTWSLSTPNASNAVVVVNPVTTTVYSVTGVNAKGCANTQTLSLKVNACTAISENEGAEEVLVFPNPAGSVLHIQVTKPAEALFFNMLGEKVKSLQLQEGVNTLQVNDLSAGHYLIQINSGVHPLYSKLIIE